MSATDFIPRTFIAPNLLIQQYEQRANLTVAEMQLFTMQRNGVRDLETMARAYQNQGVANFVRHRFFGAAIPGPSPIETFNLSRVIPEKYRDRNIQVITERDADTCFTITDMVDSFSREVLMKNPVDDTTKTMKVLLHDPIIFNNACWSLGESGVRIGNSDGGIYHPLETNPDVVSHEFGHAVVYYVHPDLDMKDKLAL
jgi:hypothetical protein